jgi:hypothetical protein
LTALDRANKLASTGFLAATRPSYAAT